MINKLKFMLTPLIGNCALIFVLYYLLNRFVFGGLTGFWGNGPFITEAIYFGPLTVIAIIMIIVFNWACYIGFQKARGNLKKIYSNNKLLLLLLASILAIYLVLNANLIRGYIVQPYSRSELAQVTWNDWEKMSSVDKLRVGQSYYWEYKGRQDGLYKASDYVTLIESLLNNYDSIDHAVFYHFCEC
ncbi:hypothetical protein KZ483_09875 [Paenibacillus sp. sptzw28]|uniref:hypothetical protein n=1 Tax=Paenibacillus sp. sptzw28 TaxID=715179 RepID=UPI001C6DDB24|nr:hypothetical protein [Paenibacillus sp. sptzw28]QYR23194.1 hypothetical protein KZ483_09875 [Paenibacillus sp. sptzw28]